ncbi:MAG: DUF4255 domain-containing protein [Gammaproteobacteria bacterium]|nr:DUF4255 domain-containing protein [Gammaproteobacteria bacterium]MDJ0870754.1 DUF4255 domain-containing protein [Gammaproteobacteria bacterium]MDJ0889931.1 DUF4255 domain-containing protein [Gammaproteobacteria bacterium]
MPLDDLSDVTRSLVRLLRLNIRRLEGIAPGDPTTITVTPEPPEAIGESAQNLLSLHCYHVAEDAYYKNLPGPGSDPPNVAKNPMGLCLYYILTAHHGTANDPTENALIQQRLLGHALKTFHDNPVITERTRVGNPAELVWPEESTHELNRLRDNQNQIQVILRPVTPEDAMAFWGTEERQTTRLSAYCEARVIFLEPERPTRIPGTVLEIGQFIFQLGAPSLDSSRSRIRFTVPGPDGGTQIAESSPARVTLNNLPGAPPEHNRLELLGANLSAGRSRTLFVSNPLWDAEFPVDPSLPANTDWAVTFGTDRVAVTLAPELFAGGAAQPVQPGIYTARVSVVLDEQLIGGQLRQLPVSSNAITFAVAPRLVDVQQPDADNAELIRVIAGDEFSLTDSELAQGDAIRVIVDGLPYERVADPPGAPQQFSVRNDVAPVPNPIPNAIRLRPHTTLASGLHPFRLIVNGAESAPFWIEVP